MEDQLRNMLGTKLMEKSVLRCWKPAA